MSLKLNERYPGRFTNPSADYPLGSFKNRTAPSAKDGSYLEKDWANDKEGFFQSLLSGAGVAANGLVDKVGSSQFYTALLTVAKNAGTSWGKITDKPTTVDGYGISDAIKKGQYGLGASDLAESGSDAIGRPGGFYFFGESANTFVQYASVLNLPYGADNSAQLAIRQGAAKASAAIRSVNAQGGWTSTAEIWTDANFNPSAKADKATTLGGYGISDAYTKVQVDSALEGKLGKSGGTIDGSLYVSSLQSLSSPAFSVSTSATGSSLSLISIKGPNTGVLLSHQNNTNTLSVSNISGAVAAISAGDVLSNDSLCHTASSFMKPVAGQWLSIAGALTLPAGGTWAYQFLNFNNNGTLIAGSTAGLVAGGTQIGSTASVGFAWRYQ